ncbi:PepSY-associated TM helix domain-containing protein [Methyloterricola oryzae]|uniref:PepSY-associated TM helix domain-containing protein n=1 Tax=Methyloterricola oryzae TaxID=1495050 RepID=UPI0005EBF0E1|nr:PepSY-associated TM helix domain-containing protein [Methyloterricola oryzae]
MTRHFWVLLHRYAGLAMALFLVLVGLTGSLLAFLSELEHIVTPQFYAASSDAPRLAPASLAERAAALAPEAQVTALWMGQHDVVNVALEPREDPATGKPYDLDYDQMMLDPWTGAELGRRSWGAISQGLVNLMPFIYKLHYSLALDEPGIWILGIVALIWTLDSFVGFYLTLPATAKSNQPTRHRTFWQRWQPSWQIKWHGSATRINFDLHRAGGLWLWAMLLIFAWSSVYMDLWDTVYTQATRLVLEYHEPWTELTKREDPLKHPALDWRQAQTVGARLMDEAARAGEFTVERVTSLRLDAEHGVYVYGVRSSLEVQDHGGHTDVYFDANSGEQKLLLLPTGQYAGNTVTSWLAALHMANVFGLPYRIFVCLFGVVLTGLSVTGVVIWLQKRRSRRGRRRVEKSSLPDDSKVRAERPAVVVMEEGSD